MHARPSSRRRFRPRFVASFLVLLLVLYLGWSLAAVPHATYTGKVAALAAPDSGSLALLAWPAYGQAAVGTTENGLLARNGSPTAVPIASVAKVMLALSVLREKPFDDNEQGETITLTQSDVDIYNHFVSVDGSVALVAAGEQITEYQALQALLLPSANNMADSLAIWAFGSVQQYDDYANNYASQLGLTHTHFADASGFDPGTVSTAVDLLKVAQLAMKNPVIADIAAQPKATIPVAGTIHNVNWLLSSGNGFVGLKTGNTDQAGGCIMFAADHTVGQKQLTVIGVILGAPNLQDSLQAAIPLLKSVNQNFVDSVVVDQGKVVGSYTTPWGDHVDAVTASALQAVVWKGTAVKAQTVIAPIKLPAHSGQTVGKVIATSAGMATQTVEVKLAGDIQPPSWWWRVTHPAQTL